MLQPSSLDPKVERSELRENEISKKQDCINNKNKYQNEDKTNLKDKCNKLNRTEKDTNKGTQTQWEKVTKKKINTTQEGINEEPLHKCNIKIEHRCNVLNEEGDSQETLEERAKCTLVNVRNKSVINKKET